MPEPDMFETRHVLDHGFIKLVRHAASDLDVVNAARVSFDQESLSLSERDEGLVSYLMREKHGTPFEQNMFKFRVKAPIVVLREWQRHRIGWSYNEQSGRYMELSNEFYMPAPSDVRVRAGKPGHYVYAPAEEITAGMGITALRHAYAIAWDRYQVQLDLGIAPEVARLCLPMATYSTMIATCNARSLMNFVNLRMTTKAQFEIRVYAQAMYDIFSQVMPVTCRAFYDNNLIAP